jgi:hypothetical protein
MHPYQIAPSSIAKGVVKLAKKGGSLAQSSQRNLKMVEQEPVWKSQILASGLRSYPNSSSRQANPVRQSEEKSRLAVSWPATKNPRIH